jgi:CHAT domain-containing protein
MRSLSVLRLLSAFLFSALLVSNTNSSFAQSISRTLEPGVSLSGELKKGELHSYRITLAAEQFLHIEIKGPLGFAVVLKLQSPDGELVAEIDQRISPFQTQRFFFVPQVAGEYRLEFGQDSIFTTPYEVKAATPRAATADDRSRYAAQQLFAEAARAANSNEDKIREATEKLPGLLSLFKSSGDLKGEAETLYLSGVLHSQLDAGTKALEDFTQTLRLTRRLGDRRAEARALTDMSDVNIGLGEPQSAIEYAEQALTLWRDLGDVDGEALALHNSSVLFRRAGEWQKSLSYQQRALELWRGKDGSEAFARLGLGHFYRGLGEQDKALDYYIQALALWEGLDSESRYLKAVGHNYLGEVYSDRGERRKALEHLNRGLELVREVRDGGLLEGGLLRNLGLAYERSGELQKALEQYSAALTKVRSVEQPSPTSEVLYRLGELHLLLGNLEKAEENFKGALSLRRQINERVGESATLSGLARVERQRGNFVEARAKVENALTIIESLRVKIINPELRASFFAQSQDSYKLYIDVLMQLHKREPEGGHAIAALLASERARARSLVESLSESRAELREGIEASVLMRERSLQQRVNAKAERLTRILAGAHKEDEATAARKELENLLVELRALQDEIRARSPRYAELTQPQPPTMLEIQAVLDPDTVLLEYSLGEERSYLWAVTSSTVNTYQLPARSEVDAGARHVYETLTARNKTVKGESAEERLSRIRAGDAQFTEAAVRLSHMILRPAEQHLQAKRLVVVSEGALQYVPFAALPVPQEESVKSNHSGRGAGKTVVHPLIAEHEIVNLPSASTLTVLRQERRKSAAKTLAVLADPVFENSDPRLRQNLSFAKAGKLARENTVASAVPTDVERSAVESGVEKLERLYFSGLEAETITAFAPERQRLKAVGFLANKANATSPDLGDYRIVHFATHGLINTRHPELSGIVLSLVDDHGEAIDGFLRLHEIYNLKLNADLVVLSACQTALGKEIKGEGFIGLSRGFMYAGAPRVVASLWRIDDRATAELVGLFYQAMLEKKLPAAAALKHAQKEMSKKWPSPYYWAGFTLQGEWR